MGDYWLNDVTIDDRYPLPHINDFQQYFLTTVQKSSLMKCPNRNAKYHSDFYLKILSSQSESSPCDWLCRNALTYDGLVQLWWHDAKLQSVFWSYVKRLSLEKPRPQIVKVKCAVQCFPLFPIRALLSPIKFFWLENCVGSKRKYIYFV